MRHTIIFVLGACLLTGCSPDPRIATLEKQIADQQKQIEIQRSELTELSNQSRNNSTAVISLQKELSLQRDRETEPAK